MNFIDFVNRKNAIKAIKESFKNDSNFDKYVNKITELLKKHINNLIPLAGYVEINSGGMTFLSKQYVVSASSADSRLFQLNWRVDNEDKELYSIDFFTTIDFVFNGKSKSALTVYTNGSSPVYFMPIIWTVVNNKNYNLSEKEAIEYGRTVFNKKNIKEYRIDYGTLKYHIFEADSETDVRNYLNQKRIEMDDAREKRNDSDEAWDLSHKLTMEYYEMLKAYQGGTAKTISDLELSLKKGVTVTQQETESEKQATQQLKREQSEDPEIVFKKMEQYIRMVIKGVNPSVILCGAPGVGKTYRVKKVLKENGYKDGDNLFVIKGKCTPRRLYLALYDYKNKGDIILIDDADALVGPKAPEDCINILKGALDSTSDDEGRLISYGIAGKILDDDGNELPKRFYYNGSVIVITNYNAGSLDTALRGRSFMQDINFSTEDILKIIKGLMPKLGEGRVSMQSKYKAYDELVKLSKTMEIEVSIRTFNICAVFFESVDDDELAKSMIKEQMKLQADRIKNKY